MGYHVNYFCPNLGLSRTQGNMSYSALHCNYYYSVRQQILLKATMLQSLKVLKGSRLFIFGWYVATAGEGPTIKATRIQAKHTSTTALTTTWETSGLSYIYGTAGAGHDISNKGSLPTGTYVYIVLDVAFVWNGVDNILLDVSRTDSEYYEPATQGHTYYCAAPGYGNIYHYNREDNATYPLTGAGTVNAWLPDLYLVWDMPNDMQMGMAF